MLKSSFPFLPYPKVLRSSLPGANASRPVHVTLAAAPARCAVGCASFGNGAIGIGDFVVRMAQGPGGLKAPMGTGRAETQLGWVLLVLG